MRQDFRLLDDIARVAGGAVNIVSGMGHQIRQDVKARVEEAISRLDLVPREEFERLETMVVKLRAEQEDLKKQLKPKAKAPAKKKTR